MPGEGWFYVRESFVEQKHKICMGWKILYFRSWLGWTWRGGEVTCVLFSLVTLNSTSSFILWDCLLTPSAPPFSSVLSSVFTILIHQVAAMSPEWLCTLESQTVEEWDIILLFFLSCLFDSHMKVYRLNTLSK